MAVPSVCGVRVATWGAEGGEHHALSHHIDQKLFGGNCGHAAISLTIPVTPENEKLIKEFCSHPPIPVEKQLVKVPRAKQDENGNWVPDLDAPPAFEQEVYIITFSWWPGGGGFFLTPSINQDGYSERVGVHREWDARFREFMDVEERVHPGQLGRTKASYAPLNIEHERNMGMTSDQRKYLNLKAQGELVERVLDSLEVGRNKIMAKQELFQEIKERKEIIHQKDKILSSKKKDVELLKIAKDAIINDNPLNLSMVEKNRLSQLFPQWMDYINKSRLKTEKEHIKYLFDEKIEQIEDVMDAIKNDTDERIRKDEALVSKPSETEMILFDRFNPGWREKYGFNKNNVLSEAQYNAILGELQDITQRRESEKEHIKEEIDALDYVNYPPDAKELAVKIKEINEQLKEKNKTKIELYQQINKLLELQPFRDLHFFFLDLLKSDKDEFTITDELKEKLDQYTTLTGLDWKPMSKTDDKGNAFILKSDLDLIDDKVFYYKEKIDALTYLGRFVDPNSPDLLKDGQLLKVTDEILAYFHHAKRYAGVDLTTFFKNEEGITKDELTEFLEHTRTFNIGFEKALPSNEIMSQSYVLYSKANKISTEIDDLKNKKNQLESHDALKEHQQIKALRKQASEIGYAFKSLSKILREPLKDLLGIEINPTLVETLDFIYGPTKDFNWRAFVDDPVPSPLTLDLMSIGEIRKDLAKKGQSTNETVIGLLPLLDSFQAQDYEAFLTMGLPPEEDYKLSLDTESDPSSDAKWGMNAAAMLKEMHQILVEGIPFNLNINNCSVTASRILAAGAKGAHLKSKFENRTLGTVATPQLVSNNTEDFLKEYKSSPEDNVVKRWARWNPIERLMGRQVHIILSPDSTPAAKRLAWLTAGLIFIVSSPLQIIRGLLSPQRTFNQCLNIIKFAASKDSVGFKLMANIVGGLGMLIFAAPALLSFIIQSPYKLIQMQRDKNEKERIKKIDEMPVDQSAKEYYERSKKERQLYRGVLEAEGNIVTIQGDDPIIALNEAKKVMEEGKIPLFEPQTRLNIEKYIGTLGTKALKDNIASEYKHIIDYAADKVKEHTQAGGKRPRSVSPSFEGARHHHSEGENVEGTISPPSKKPRLDTH